MIMIMNHDVDDDDDHHHNDDVDDHDYDVGDHDLDDFDDGFHPIENVKLCRIIQKSIQDYLTVCVRSTVPTILEG